MEKALAEAVASSTSIAEVCRKLGYHSAGGNTQTIKHHITRLDLDTSHHLGQAWNRGNYQLPSSSNTRKTIKERLIREHGHRCWKCGNFEWNGLPIALELEHKNGMNNDNREENLEILCPNCHAQTPTYRRRRKSPAGVVELVYTEDLSPSDESHARSSRVTRTLCIVCNLPCQCNQYWHKTCQTCIDCGKSTKSLRCKSCAGRVREFTKIDWPTNEELLKRLETTNYSALGRELGVSDNAIRKRLKQQK